MFILQLIDCRLPCNYYRSRHPCNY
jgi:hypothetical protein